MHEPEENPDRPDQVPTEELSPRLAEDQFYQALASAHRRRLLWYLLENGESTVEELASVLSGWEVTPTGTMSGPENRAAILLELQHNHLPRLADAELIAYDAETVQLEPVQPQVGEVIRRSVEAERLEARE